MIGLLHFSDFDKVFAIMEQSFPIDEYRTYEAQKALLNDPAYHICVERDNNDRIRAFIAVWDLDGCLFIEHLACSKEYRNNGLGSSLLKFILESTEKLVCLEVEPPESEINVRRIGFYERNGFVRNPYAYKQPSLSPGRSSVPLFIMTSGRAVNEAEFASIRHALYSRVYQCI